ncbi:hypothetical protein ACP70R_014383 [Stipagrostis hirtigluma subsp. patula]
MITVNQSAFVKKRNILDNFVFVRSAARALHKGKHPSALLKIDIAKAFDTVAWPFLLEVLQQFGFGPRWREWIAIILRSSSSRLLLNGAPGRPIQHKRGLRQGDPLSPMLFILIMEVLNRLFVLADSSGALQPLPIPTIKYRVSLYADDLIMFLSPTAQDFCLAKEILSLFGDAPPR